MPAAAAAPRRRLLLALPQSLFDLGSGAAVSMRLLACQLALRGWQVQALCTTATESGRSGLPPAGPRWPDGARQHLGPAAPGLPDRWRVHEGGMAVDLLVLPTGTRQDWARHAGSAWEAAVLAALQSHQPDLLLTFGADPIDHRIARAAQAAGCGVVLALHNLAYLQRPLPPHDALLMPSAFLADRYRGASGAPVGVLPPPMWDPDTRVDHHDPVFFTFFNPEPAKGAALLVRLAAALPALPFLVVAGRAGAPELAAIASRLGHPAGTLANITVSPGGVPVRDLLAISRAVLVPSLVEESAGRVAAEALANGIPALVSDAGALPETAQPGGQVLPLQRDARGPLHIGTGDLARWVAAVQALADEVAWQAARAGAQAASTRWQVAHQAAAADAWFSTLADALHHQRAAGRADRRQD